MKTDKLIATRRHVKLILLTTTPAAVFCLVTAGFTQPGRLGGGGGGFSEFQNKVTSTPGSWSLSRVLLGERAPVSSSPANSRAPTMHQFDVAEPSQSPSAMTPLPPVVQQEPGNGLAPIVHDQPNAAEASVGDMPVSAQPVSTFSADVDTSSYSSVRRIILAGGRPSPDQVRVEEMINYFRYALPAAPSAGTPFSITTDVVRSPWHPDRLVARVALAGREVPRSARPPANLVLLVDVSGSMSSDNKLGLIQRAFSRMADRLGPRDRVSIVTYAGDVSVRLTPTSDMTRVKQVLAGLGSGGGTNGSDGLQLAYQQARAARIPGGINRVIIATDGDFNIGTSDTGSLKSLIEQERQDGITLSTVGVGQTFNDGMMESIADAGNGNAIYLDDDLEAQKALGDELEGSINVIAKDVKAQVEFNPAVVSSYRFIGYRNRRLSEQAFDNDAVDAGDIGSGHQVTALYEITPTASPGSDVAARRRYEANRVRDGQPLIEPMTASNEAFYVKVRYKLPNGQRSVLLQRSVPSSALATAGTPIGDTAFALAVASFGQRLDGTLGPDFGPDRILQLAGNQDDARRAEFIAMVGQRPHMLQPPTSMTKTILAPVAPQQVIAYPSMNRVERQNFFRVFGWWLMAFSGMLALVLVAIDRRLRHLTSGQRVLPSDTDANRDDHGLVGGKAMDAVPVLSALRAARAEGNEKSTRAIDAFEAAIHRAVSVGDHDGDIADEVRTIVERHAPAYVDDYVAMRRRATTAHAHTLDENLATTLDTMGNKLRHLLGEQSRRGVARLREHAEFIEKRHAQSSDALA